MSNIHEGIFYDRKQYWSEVHNGWVHLYRASRYGKLIVLAETQTKVNQGMEKFRATGEPQIAQGYWEEKPCQASSQESEA
jgi:hypothetical protein